MRLALLIPALLASGCLFQDPLPTENGDGGAIVGQHCAKPSEEPPVLLPPRSFALQRCLEADAGTDALTLNLPVSGWFFHSSSAALQLTAAVDDTTGLGCGSYVQAPDGGFLLRDGGVAHELGLYLPVTGLSETLDPTQLALPVLLRAERLDQEGPLDYSLQADVLDFAPQLEPQALVMDSPASATFYRGFARRPDGGLAAPTAQTRVFTLPDHATMLGVWLDTVPTQFGVDVRLLDPNGVTIASRVDVHSLGLAFYAQLPGANTGYTLQLSDLVDESFVGCPNGGLLPEPPPFDEAATLRVFQDAGT